MFLLPGMSLTLALTTGDRGKFPGIKRFLPGRRADELPDEELVRRAVSGSAEAVEELVRRHRRPIYNLALRMVGPDEAADILQETFLEMVRSLDRFRGEASIRSWLYRVAANRCLDLLRRRKRRPSFSLEDLLESGGDRALGNPDNIPDPDRIGERQSIEKALNELPTLQRAVVILRDVQGLSYEEIARALDVPAGTVKSRLARARSHLADRLREGSELSDSVRRQRD